MFQLHRFYLFSCINQSMFYWYSLLLFINGPYCVMHSLLSLSIWVEYRDWGWFFYCSEYCYPLEIHSYTHPFRVKFSAFTEAYANHMSAYFVPPSTHYCLVNRGIIEEKCTCHFYSWPAVRIKPQTFWSWVSCPVHWTVHWTWGLCVWFSGLQVMRRLRYHLWHWLSLLSKDQVSINNSLLHSTVLNINPYSAEFLKIY